MHLTYNFVKSSYFANTEHIFNTLKASGYPMCSANWTQAYQNDWPYLALDEDMLESEIGGIPANHPFTRTKKFVPQLRLIRRRKST